MKDKLLQIIEHYGVSHQISKLLEEIGELIEAIIDEDKDKDNMISELADCFVLLNQFVEYYGITNDEIQEIMKYKVNRQIERIKKGE